MGTVVGGQREHVVAWGVRAHGVCSAADTAMAWPPWPVQIGASGNPPLAFGVDARVRAHGISSRMGASLHRVRGWARGLRLQPSRPVPLAWSSRCSPIRGAPLDNGSCDVIRPTSLLSNCANRPEQRASSTTSQRALSAWVSRQSLSGPRRSGSLHCPTQVLVVVHAP